MIRIEKVRKEYGSKVAVEELSLDVQAGELFAFLGPNGAGKTTTIKMIVGLLRPSSGRVTVCGHDVLADPIAAKQVMAYVPDQPFLYDKLAGIEFLSFIGDMYGVPRAERESEIGRLVELFDMKGWIRELTETYSHGMKQRVVLAATLIHKPKVIVLDEPLVGLDPHTARLVREILREQAKAGTTIFMSTHVIPIAEETADRIGILMNGKVAALGRMEELRAQAGSGGRLEELFFKITESAQCSVRSAQYPETTESP
jgi:ABC-2 type transport system ATP-binding protein